ncbi:MAG: hypothetical protein LBO76_01345 [Treponema sp.]|jgi:hypothetical protein|nr:hypothetical protein [Treponema sp.]
MKKLMTIAAIFGQVLFFSCLVLGEKSFLKEKAMETPTLFVHPVPREIRDNGLYRNDDFSVQVRLAGGQQPGPWQDLFAWRVRVNRYNPSDVSMVQFDFRGTVEVRVTPNNGDVNAAVIRPLSKNIRPEIRENSVLFTMDEPAKLSVEINGDRSRNLHLFANPPETEKPSPDDPDVVYYGEGVHLPPALGFFFIPSNKTVYLAPGAILRGKIAGYKTENARVIGRGVVLQPERGFQLDFCKNIEIDGITVINHKHYGVFGGQSTGIKIRNVKTFSSQIWADGLDFMSCSDVTIEDVFMRTSDDAIAIYAHRWDYYGDAKNYVVKDAVLWPDTSHPINIGLHGDTSSEGNVIEKLRFSNIDILEHNEKIECYQGCMAFSVGDHNLVRDVVFDNIRIEEITTGMLCSLRIFFTPEWHTGPGRGIENIVFKNIFLDYTVPPGASRIHGYDKDRLVKNVRFENIVIKGERAALFEEANINIEQFAQDIGIN